MEYNKYFSENYYQARNKFRKLSLKNNLRLESKKIIDDLTIDFAFLENNEKEKLLILVSGTHGVEGFTGSAVQLFFLEKILPELKDNISVALIHSLNPYGMKYLRRYNHNNIDLNRNYINNFKNIDLDKKTIEDIKKLRHLMSPQRPAKAYFTEQVLHYYYIFKTIIKIGTSRLIRATSKGQNIYPNTVAYCGVKKEEETKYLEAIVKSITKGYKEVIFIDLHTGTAKRNTLNIYTRNKEYKRKFKKINKNTYLKDTKTKRGMDYIGGNDKLFLENSKAEKSVELTLEFGPFSRINSLFSIEHTSFLITYENMITFFGPKEKLKKARQKLKERFSPNRKDYKKFVIKKSAFFFEKLFKYF
jgi:hypothetical protein